MEAYPPQYYNGTDFVVEQWNYGNESTTYNELQDSVAAVKLEILDGVDNEALNSIKEIADSLNNDADFGTTMLASLATCVKKTGDETIAGVKTFTSNINISGDIAFGDARRDTYPGG
jgi:hypothetical protein